MLRLADIRLPLDHSEEDLAAGIVEALGIGREDLLEYRICRKSVDARKRSAIFIIYSLDVEVRSERTVFENASGSSIIRSTPETAYRFVGHAPNDPTSRPVVVGAGPCGLFAALTLAQMGFRPVLLERGKRVRERSRDVSCFWRTGVLNPESNALFGEGGAGAFSDGKLTTQIKDRENRCRKVLEELAAAGAPEEILYLSKPHIGTDLLAKVIRNLRRTIVSNGGEVRFESRVADIRIEDGAVRGVILQTGEEIGANCVVLAIGHSARDTYKMLSEKGVVLEPKPFSLGLRIEHPQSMIDFVQYGRFAGHPGLGPADYKLSHHCSNGRSAYTFCMCPGGSVIAATSESGCVVTNGMSHYRRNRPNANSALLVGVFPSDFPGEDPLSGISFQRHWERKAFELGGGDYRAPAQLVADFLASQPSRSLGEVEPSYEPGVALCELGSGLPPYVLETLHESLPVFDRKIRGFARPDAVLTGVETRSSSPVRILRNTSMESLSVAGLFPAGEGAGYAGGIVSAAVDGIKAAEAVAANYLQKE